MAMTTKAGLVTQVAQKLERANIPFSTGASAGGMRPDFLLETHDGKRIVLEVKQWEPNTSNQKRAIKQAGLIKKYIGADEAFIVLPDLKLSDPSKGLLSFRTVADVLLSYPHLVQPFPVGRKEEENVVSERVIVQGTDKLQSLGSHQEEEKETRQLKEEEFGIHALGKMVLPEQMEVERHPPSRILSATGRLIFAAMPFAGVYDDTFFRAMAPAAKSVNAVCERVDQEEFQGDIIEKIKKDIHQSIAVISDLSESNPNVLYETGYAHGLGLPTIHICSTPLEALPFDVRNWKTIKYAIGQTYKLEPELERELKAMLET